MALDGYIRVSDVRGRKGESFISPDVQREQIELWARSRQIPLAEVFVELDESGGRADRPMLLRAIERVEAGHSGGVVVAKLDRFGRSLLDGLSAISRIEAAGGTFVSVQDGFDLDTPTGRLMLRMMLAWAEWELERIRINGDIACERAVARGVYVARKGPPGYLRAQDGRLRVDLERAGPIMEAFRLRAGGASAREVADFLNRSSFTTFTGVPIRAEAIYPIIKNRAYLGESHHGRHVNPRAHQPLVDPQTWRKAQFRLRHRFDPTAALLARTIRCASCGRSMVNRAPQTKRSPSAHYRCYVMHRPHKGRCSGPAAARAEEIEPLVEDFVIERARSEPFSGSGIDLSNLDARWPLLSQEQRKRIIAEVIDWVAVERGRGPIAERAWLNLHGADSRPRGWNEPLEQFNLDHSETVRLPVPRQWPEARIQDGLALFLRDREKWPDYAEFAEAGYSRLHLEVMRFGGPYWWGPRFDIPIPARFVIWNEARVRGALRPFLRGRETFPSEREFAKAGLRSLRTAIVTHGGGIDYWAAEFGLHYRAKSDPYSKAQLQSELEELLAEREHFPTQLEFQQAGRLHLFHAVKRHGGTAYWQRRFEIQPPIWSKHAKLVPTNELARRFST
jgi:DNA invertase Pin-like site-specific DNA recombinase